MTLLGRKTIASLVILTVLLLVGTAVSVTIGTADIGVGRAYGILSAYVTGGLDSDALSPQETIILLLRLPRILMAIATGAALSVTGTVLQGVFRNPMADPYVLGVSSGAALGVSIVVILGVVNPILTQLSAFGGAMGSLVLVLAVAAAAGGTRNSYSLLLSGIAVSLFLSALISLLMYLNHEQAERILFWTFGSLSTSSWSKVGFAVPTLTGGVVLLLFQGRRLNVLMQGDETAQSLGMDPGRDRFFLLVFGAFVTSAAVSVVGIIGFVGLLIPHAMRLILGPDNRSLLPVAALAGGLFLLVADMFGRIVIAPAEVPVGIVTALVGTPYLLFLLIIRRGGKT